MTDPSMLSIFDSFNARYLKPAQVAKTFVPSLQYKKLTGRSHTIVVGPRGSGKTTLLKMLTQPALEAWKHDFASRYQAYIDFTGVFVATDVSWSEQLKALGDGALDAGTVKLLGTSAFTTHILKSLVVAFLNRIATTAAPSGKTFRRVSMSSAGEAELTESIARVWHLNPRIPTLISVKHALTQRLAEIQEIASSEVSLGTAGRGDRLGKKAFLHVQFVSAAGAAIELFDDLTVSEQTKWALLFDELELAPKWIRDELLRSLRATDDRFLFKLALSPSTPDLLLMKNSLTASPGNDFDEIPLWYAEKNDAYSFCEDLWDAMLKERGIEPKDPRSALGPSYFETSPHEWAQHGTAYVPNSKMADKFKKLSASDPSFRRYLEERSINPARLDLLTSDQRASDVRKAAPLIPVREFYRARKNPLGKRKRATRSRKQPLLYAGAESLFSISEGNPRWFIAIVTSTSVRLEVE